MMTQSYDPRDCWWVCATHNLSNHRKVFHGMERFTSQTDANKRCDEIKADSLVMISDDITAIKKLVKEKRGSSIRDDLLIEEYRWLYPPRYNVDVFKLEKQILCKPAEREPAHD